MKRGLLIVLMIMALLPSRVAAAELPADGRYTVEVTLSGGSGRASVETPAKLSVEDGHATAAIVWSSPHYEYMRIGNAVYYPVNADGNSAFEIPVALDEDMAVSAQTVAMSQPHEIDYILYFDSGTIKQLGSDKYPYLLPAAIAAAVLTAAFICVFLYKRRNKNLKSV